ncbi:bifunctional phosphoribosylaminoimidazolecarboxamide formyltransferase/IMP cyclohydrolase [Wenzhouxiangella marina]|uniref:Bifunctional purine biosynthesis protein PurH n=1 Tax=Wenzhouxiangella marina TaxID=1579979 RepID=A0A0K0XSB6_9GAMM|nr:bifunctional phosphoribosylaminoimidazolecarboxamide formyltransferase/IMP cyclohydrolase [Wenzhouxiangella marina]AKS40550.1 Bifunctional purine biosynthesis protein PurH [Wenzhouxiangella marina]MBB6088318.1 phosphoribosylaminoimidazolecarboxamide formyltransferase/IMP cyclohydrolase [Wenzhouxiangella marina]
MNATRTALISVSDKTGVVELGRALHEHGWTLLSTGGTARSLREAGIDVTEVSDHTGFPEIMGGRVKTLQPSIHGGILGRRGQDEEVMRAHGIKAIDLVVVNLYPFAATVARPDCTREEAIEQIDIGGPAMVRAAAKNHADVGLLVDPADYPAVIAGLPELPDAATRRRLAVKGFAHTAAYDGQISQYLSQQEDPEGLPPVLNLALDRISPLRYGENPHQAAAVYRERQRPTGGLAGTQPIQGKALSYNNLLDADAAWSGVQLLGDAQPACVIIKHTNPCGAAIGDSLRQAWERALACDPTSAFGGIVACNRTIDAGLAEALAERFLEVIIAPDIAPAAREILAGKKNLRVLIAPTHQPPGLELKAIDGGWLVQQADLPPSNSSEDVELSVATEQAPDDAQLADLRVAWAVVRMVRSNAIVYVKDGATVGIGAGQMSRVDSARIGTIKAADAGLSLEGAVMASDAFFPFADSIEAAAAQGIKAVIQPGGSMRDQEVIDACNRHGIAMVLTGRRHFRH